MRAFVRPLPGWMNTYLLDCEIKQAPFRAGQVERLHAFALALVGAVVVGMGATKLRNGGRNTKLLGMNDGAGGKAAQCQ